MLTTLQAWRQGEQEAEDEDEDEEEEEEEEDRERERRTWSKRPRKDHYFR